ncbi:MAG: tetratricopeptide repeat protein, partial [Chitinophagaceae bacterium]
LNDKSADAVLVFTDGNNTYGKSKPRKGTKPVFCIHTSSTANLTSLNQIVGSGGGKVIDLNKKSLSSALSTSRTAENWLMNVTSSSGKLMIEQIMPLKHDDLIFVNGVTQLQSDTIFFQYGNESRIHHIEKIVINQNECEEGSIDRITMLNNFNDVIRTYSWSNLIDYGIKEKVVTPHTAYIVLERVEDYVRYNITPPKELEAECEKLNYVKRDTRWDRRKIVDVTEFSILKNVVDKYNERARKWDAGAKTIYLDRQEFDKQIKRSIISDEMNPSSVEHALNEKVAGVANQVAALDEVVVTGYGMARRKELTGAVTHISASDIFQGGSTVAQVLQGKVSGIQVTNSTGAPERNATIVMRGSASLSSGNQPLFILDGSPVAGNINDVVNVHDIESITVVKGQTGFALYGSRAASGVIVIKTKRGKNNYNVYNNKPYRLKDMEDVAYLRSLKAVPVNEKITMYQQLKEEYGGEPGFYMDVAQHFFEKGLKQSAFDILMNAGEAANGSPELTIAMAYMLESWGAFAEAIIVYEQLLEENPYNLISYSDLAWCLYQQGKYQEAVNVLYKAVRMNTGEFEYSNLSLKAVLLNDMNAMIGLHRDT